MSYKIDLSGLQAGSRQTTQQLVRRFVEAIEAGEFAPGERLPTTRELARDAEVNPVTAARVYRRLAELGYVTATVGRGTFVRSLPPFASDELDDEWQSIALPGLRFPARERVVQEALRLSLSRDVVSLAAAYAASETIPAREIGAAAAAVIAEGPGVLHYTDVEGVPELRDQLGELGRLRGFAAGGDEILVTTGARQGIDLAARAILREGDVVCVESPTFVGILGSLESTGARVIGIPTDEDGLDVEALERALTRYPVKLVALQPACQNPTGRHLSEPRRRRLVELALERSFFVLEDGVYADLVFAGEAPQALRHEAPAHFLYVGSFAKVLGGGLRVGWIAARGPVFNRLVALKTQTDLNTSPFDQRVIARYLESGSYPALLERVAPLLSRRAASLAEALERHLPGETDALEPLGGHNIWTTFRRRVNEQALYAEAIRRGVSVMPGGSMLAEPSTRTCLRLTFSLCSEEQLDEGIKRLAAAFNAVLREERYAATGPLA
jgi:DNA-binding transcriptional MocR family regulator